MTEQGMTREFSLCLLPTKDVTEDLQALRAKLPDSPYRDDEPHITLLRGISSAEDMTDDALLEDVNTVLSPTDQLPLTGTVASIENKSNQFYSPSGVMLLRSSEALSDFRRDAVRQLTEHHYTVEPQELETFMPHITIRLGVPLEGETLNAAKATFDNRTITFSRWVLLRLVLQDGKRLMHEVQL